MKKITLLTLLFVSALGFSQQTETKLSDANRSTSVSHSVNSLGTNSPIYVQQAAQRRSVTVSEESRTASQVVNSLGANSPVYVQNSARTVQYQSITSGDQIVSSFGENNPIFYTNRTAIQNNYVSPFLSRTADTEAEILADQLWKQQNASSANRNNIINTPITMADIIPTAGATETFTPDVGDNFFDPGGPGGSSTGGTAGNYPNCDCDTVSTLDGVTEIDFLFFSVFAPFDYLIIYDSADTTGPILFDNSTGGINEGDITLADMIASNGSSTITGTSGSLTFFFHATGVVDYGGWDAEIITASGGGGGGGSACSLVGPGNAFENGKSFTNNLGRVVAHDVTVASDEDYVLESISLNAFIGGAGSGVNAAFVDVYVYADAGGTPGALITSELGMVPTSQTVVGSNFGFDVWEVILDVVDVPLAGQAGLPTTYWIGASLEPTDASNTFWENSTAGLIGLGEAYDDGLGGGFVIDNLLEGVYTIDGTCTPMGGGGGGGPCSLVGPGNAFENGKSFTNNLGRVVAHDVTVASDEDYVLESISLNAFIGGAGSGVNAAFVDVYVYADAGGTPGALITSELGMVPTSQTVVGSNFGFDVWEVILDVVDVPLAGQAGLPTTYWIGASLEPTDASNTFWENSTAGLIGLGEAYDDGLGGGFVIDNLLEGVYTIDGTCTPMGGGGGGGPCSLVGPGNAFENGKSFTNNLGRVVAHDVTVASDEDYVLESISLNAFIGGAGSGVNAAFVDVYVYADAGGTPGALITSELGMVPTSQTVVGSNFGFDVWEVILDVVDVPLAGQAGLPTTYWIGASLEPTDASNTFWENSTAGLIGLGEAYDDGLGGGFVIDNLLEGVYTIDGTCTPMGGGPNNDDCADAFPIACGDVYVGSTVPDTDSGGNPAPDEFFTFTGSGSPELVTLSLCDGGTDYDSLLRVFSDCTLANELATNDDACGLQSELTFLSDGTSTYIIMVEGFGSNAGNFSLAVTCEMALVNDECEGALPMACGDIVSGSTIDATFDAGAPVCTTAITAPGVWYVYEDTTGLVTDITLTMCNGTTDYDSKITVYTGDCGALVCETDNDDTCGLQSEVMFQSDGNTTFYILVHGFGGATGNFELEMICAPIPPPNDMIVNSIDVDEIGVPYTDPAVAMPAATTEAGGTPAGCDNAGVKGVWYNFVPEGDGTATATIITPSPATVLFSVNNGPLAGNYPAVAADFGGVFTTTPITEDTAVVVDDGTSGDPNDACDPIQNGPSLVGKIAIVRRGACEFGDKALAAENEGAIAVIVVNNAPGDPIVMGGGVNGGSVTIPTLMVTDVDGEAIIAEVLGGGTVNATMVLQPEGFSSVTFYTAPNEMAVETDLTLVPWVFNQCVPGVEASINTVAGQAYYVYVANHGSITDIVIDGTNLGVTDNTIEGFVYYPNPADSTINLSSIDTIENVVIYNMLGQAVLNQNVGATTSQLNVSNLATGAYIMKATVNGQTGTYKIIKR